MMEDKSHNIVVIPHEDNFFLWDLLIPGPVGTIFEHAFFPAQISFPSNYPMQPPKLKFMVDMNHPNGVFFCIFFRVELSTDSDTQLPVQYLTEPLLTLLSVYPDGTVCISILHPPGDDPNLYEDASERWSPAHSAQSIILSIMSLLPEPNCDSPANVDASKMFRENRKEYDRRVRQLIDSLYEIPSSASSSSSSGGRSRGNPSSG